MKKLVVLTVLTAVMAVTACGTTEPEQSAEAATAAVEMPSEETLEETTEEESVLETETTTEVAAEGTLFESEYAEYRVYYDDSIFEVESYEGADRFLLLEQDLEKEALLYVAIAKTDDTMENIVEGLLWQSDVDGLVAEDAVVGKLDYEGKYFWYESDYSEVGPFYQAFTVVKANEGSYILEVGCGDRVSPEIQTAIGEIIDSFEIIVDNGDSVQESSDYSIFTDISKEEVTAFAQEIQDAFAKQDYASLSDKIAYPLTIGSQTFQNEAEFAAYDFAGAFTEEFLNAIANTDTENMFANSEGAMFGDGQLWISECLDDDGKSMGLKIISIWNEM